MARALVTGASGGIGAAICQLLSSRGFTLLLHYQQGRAAAEETLRGLSGSGHELLQADLCDAAASARLWRAATAGGRVEVLVNNAGIFPDHPPLSSSYPQWTAAWQRTLAINLIGAAHLA